MGGRNFKERSKEKEELGGNEQTGEEGGEKEEQW